MTPLFRRLLGPTIERLPPALARVHDATDDLVLTGTAEVWRSANPLANLLCDLMRLPHAGTHVPVVIRFERQGEGERWHRRFADRTYASSLAARDDLLTEHMGPVTNLFRLKVDTDRLHLELIGFRLLGIPLPAFLRPSCHAIEAEEDGAFTFDIPISLPVLGPVIHYRGRLTPEDA